MQSWINRIDPPATRLPAPNSPGSYNASTHGNGGQVARHERAGLFLMFSPSRRLYEPEAMIAVALAALT